MEDVPVITTTAGDAGDARRQLHILSLSGETNLATIVKKTSDNQDYRLFVEKVMEMDCSQYLGQYCTD